MSRRLSLKLAAATIPSVIAILWSASPSLAVNLGNGPSAPPRAPAPFDEPSNQPLISLQFKNGKVISLTGSAVPRSDQKKPGRVAPAATRVRCSVNFTNSRRRQGNRTYVRWFGGIGCSQSMFLFGEAYLHESATKIDGVGPHYQGVMQSAASGRNQTIVNAPNPSLYIRHLANVYFPSSVSSGQISVYPAAGQRLNAASRCVAARTPGYSLGVHCDLYTNRF